MLKRYLVVLGGTPFSDASVRHAIELAQRHGAELTALVLVARQPVAIEPTASASRVARLIESQGPDLAGARRKLADEFLAQCRSHRVPADAIIGDADDPIAQLIDLWRYHDLVIFGLRGLYDYELFPEPHHVVARLVRAGVRPILASASTYRHIRRVLIAYDGTTSSAKALKTYVQGMPWPDAMVEIVVFGPSPETARPLLDDAADYCRAHGLRVDTHHHAGTLRNNLLDHAATSGADLIVLGDGFDASLASMLLDDTATHILRHADRPVLCTH